MKTTWVLSEEERKKKFEGRKINRKRRRRSQEEDGDQDEESDDPAAAVEEPHLISEAETLEVTELVKISGHHDISKVNDMETSLIRDIIRSVESVVSEHVTNRYSPLQNGRLQTPSAAGRAADAQGCVVEEVSENREEIKRLSNDSYQRQGRGERIQ